MRSIETLEDMKSRIDWVWRDISLACSTCNEPDCIGYIWVVPEEEDVLLDVGVQTVQVNDTGPIFIDSYHRDRRGHLQVWREKPRCPYRAEDGTCRVHSQRPFVCHLYPMGFERLPDGRLAWVLYESCKYVKSLTAQRRQDLFIELATLVQQVSQELRSKLLAYFKSVDHVALSMEQNEYTLIKEI